MRPHAVEDEVVRSLIDAGRSVLRVPVAEGATVHNVETVLQGQDIGAPHVLVCARYGDPSSLLFLVALARELRASLQASVRFVARAPGGITAVAGQGLSHATDVGAAFIFDGLSLARTGRTTSVVFVGDLHSISKARAAARAFRRASRTAVHVLLLPSWTPGVHAPDADAFRRQGWPVIRAFSGPPWFTNDDDSPPDVDHVAAAVPGFVAAVSRLAGVAS